MSINYMYREILPVAGKWLLAVMIALGTANAGAQPVTLKEAIRLALESSPDVAIADARKSAAQASLQVSHAYQNPELEYYSGETTSRLTGAAGRNEIIGLAQPLELYGYRGARQEAAAARLEFFDAGLESARINKRAAIKQAYFEVLRRKEEAALAKENYELLMQIRNRVKIKVKVGESARYELVKSEAETLTAESALRSAELHVGQALDVLNRLIGIAQDDKFDVLDEPLANPDLPSLAELHKELQESHPQLREAAAGVRSSKANIEQERAARLSQITLKISSERDPDNTLWRVGVAVPIPLWNRRSANIQEAYAHHQQAIAAEKQSRLGVASEINQAYGRYEIALRQVDAFESGLLKEAEVAMKVAEAAYRYGERGIIDYLDAQRIWRSTRIDFLNARYELQSAMIEIERLRALPISGDA